MKMNKTVGRVATTLVATAMLASLAAVPAFAESNDVDITDNGYFDDVDNTPIDSFSFTKELVRPATGTTPQVTFNFSMTGVNSSETITAGGKTVVTSDATGKSASGSVSFGDSDDSVGAEDQYGRVTVTDDVKIELGGITFDQPGVYKFNLTETKEGGASTGYTMGITESNWYNVYLYVERIAGQANPVVTGVELVNGDHGDTKSDTITNYYMTTPTGVTPNSLTVTKKVEGEMGNRSANEKFNFTIVVTPKNNEARTYSADGATSAEMMNGEYKVTAALSHDGSVTINGLMEGDTYTITETANNKGYTIESIASTGVVDDEGENVSILEDGQAVVFDDAAADSVVYTNKRDAVSPTGIVMNVAPYALLVVIAAAGCFVFLRKRRED